MPFLKSLPDDANAAHVFSLHPHIYKLYSCASRAIMRGPSPLSFGERELIGAFVSTLNGCRYCAGAHIKTAEMFGIDPLLLESLIEDIDSVNTVDEKLKSMLHYVKKLVETPYKLVERDAEAIYAMGWDEAAFHSMVPFAVHFSL